MAPTLDPSMLDFDDAPRTDAYGPADEAGPGDTASSHVPGSWAQASNETPSASGSRRAIRPATPSYHATAGHADPMQCTLRDVAQQAAHHVGELFERRLNRGDINLETLFHESDASVASKADMHGHALRTFTARELPAIRLPIIETFPQIAFACCTDRNGHLRTAHQADCLRVSAPIFVHGRRWGTFHIGYHAPTPIEPPLGMPTQDGCTL